MWGGGWGSGGWGAGTWFSSSDPNGDNSDDAVCDYEDPDPTNAWQGVSPEPGTPKKRPCSKPPNPNSADCTKGFARFMVNFVTAHYADAVALSTMSGVPQDWLLAWSADESSYGASSIAKKSGNYFGWHGKGDINCPSGTNKITGCFSSYYASGFAALFSTQNWFHYNGKYHVSAASILTQYTNPEQAFQALSNAGYNSNHNYGAEVAGAYFLGNVDGIEDCLRSQGKLK